VGGGGGEAVRTGKIVIGSIGNQRYCLQINLEGAALHGAGKEERLLKKDDLCAFRGFFSTPNQKLKYENRPEKRRSKVTGRKELGMWLTDRNEDYGRSITLWHSESYESLYQILKDRGRAEWVGPASPRGKAGLAQGDGKDRGRGGLSRTGTFG